MLRSTNYTKKLSGTIRHLPHQDLHPSTCWKAGRKCRKAQSWEAPTTIRNCQVPFHIFHINIFIPRHCWKAWRNCRKAQCWEAWITKELSGTHRHLPHQHLHLNTHCWKAGNWLAERLNAEKHQLLRNCQAPFDIFHIKIFIPSTLLKSREEMPKGSMLKSFENWCCEAPVAQGDRQGVSPGIPLPVFFTKRLAPMSVPPK